jgi:hypothetical protein
MQRLTANVRTHTGKTRHGIGTMVDGVPTMSKQFSNAARVEIEERNEGYFLMRFTEQAEFAGDTWHQTLEEAKGQAHFEYAIEEDDWEVL